ncbi:ABC transporter permease [Streptomyces kanamyceticus]|uniref:ABC transporter permease n=1 Tax=Streptomyces kanamyceticus TaxID=1967 RepID=A0A5J6GAX6_STRKN|nr:ABC transporter permease [Streptomyces kanamyceticus]QEU91115.1 ABC transporter permease [Streptomyces kanamyceticus]
MTATAIPSGPTQGQTEGRAKLKGGGLRGALAFEWTKLWTVRSTWWNLLAAVVLMTGFSAIVGMSAEASAKNGVSVAEPAPHAATDAVLLVQLTTVMLATLAITSEYASRSILTTLQSVPVRKRMFFAKSVVVTAVALVTGMVFSALGTLVAAPLMGDYGEFTGGEFAKTALGTGAYLALLALFTVGLGTMMRSAAGTITTVIMMLLAVPQIMSVVGVDWLKDAADYMPGNAGVVLMTQDTEPYGSGTALIVLLVWTLVSFIGGRTLLRRRDA